MRLEPNDSAVLTVTATAAVATAPIILQGLVLSPAAASCSVALYDPAPGIQTTTGATHKITLTAAAAGGSVCLPADAGGIYFKNGCVAVVVGAGALATVISAKI